MLRLVLLVPLFWHFAWLFCHMSLRVSLWSSLRSSRPLWLRWQISRSAPSQSFVVSLSKTLTHNCSQRVAWQQLPLGEWICLWMSEWEAILRRFGAPWWCQNSDVEVNLQFQFNCIVVVPHVQCYFLSDWGITQDKNWKKRRNSAGGKTLGVLALFSQVPKPCFFQITLSTKLLNDNNAYTFSISTNQYL